MKKINPKTIKIKRIQRKQKAMKEINNLVRVGKHQTTKLILMKKIKKVKKKTQKLTIQMAKIKTKNWNRKMSQMIKLLTLKINSQEIMLMAKLAIKEKRRIQEKKSAVI